MVEENALTEPKPGSDIGRGHVVADVPRGTDPGSARTGVHDALGPIGDMLGVMFAVR